MMAYREGQTATNPKTGQQVVFKGGQWVSASAPSAVPRKLPTREQMQLDDARSAATQADEAARTAERFVDLNQEQGSGEIWAIPGLPALAGAVDPEIGQMNALTARMAPQQRVPGSGTTSDRDLSLYLQAVPSMGKPGPANAAISKQARTDAERRARYAEFLDRYAQEKGTLNGALEAWNSGAKDAAETPKPDRAPIQSRIAPQGLTDSQKRAAGRYKGTKADSGTERNPSIPTSEEQYNALPPGTWYIHPSGAVTQKKK